jgi:hypothetical protein
MNKSTYNRVIDYRVIFFSFFQHMPGYYFKMNNDLLLSNPYTFTFTIKL